jgi:hypothetical protein
MSDIGTRLEHLADLQDLWGTALCILTTGTYHNEREIAQAADIEIALKLLENHMANDYNETQYAKDINDLPIDPRDIKDNKEKP